MRRDGYGLRHEAMQACDPVAAVNARARAEGWHARADASLSFRQAELIALRDIWLDAAQDRLPARAVFSARTLKPFLPHVAILEIVQKPGGGTRYVHRFVGTAITRGLGELTGLGFEDFLPAEALPRTTAFFAAAVEGRCALRIITQFQMKRVDYLCGEILAMPLADDGVVPDRLMSASYFSTGADNPVIAEIQSR